jgi:acyl carrier protein phosphodiesterase
VSFDAQRDAVGTLEEEYRKELAPEIQTGGQGMQPAEYFRWADELTRIRPAVQNLEHWEQIESQMIAPHVHQVLRALGQHFAGQLAERWEAWRDRYLPQFLLLLKELRREATVKSREKTAALTERLDPLLPEARRKERLSRKALWVLLSTPGVTCVLNGMRTPAYVADSMAALRWPALGDARAVYEAVKTPPF